MFVIKNKKGYFVESFNANNSPIMTDNIYKAFAYSYIDWAKMIIDSLDKNEFQVIEAPDREGFTITCNVCGSTNCEIFEEIDYDYDERPYTNGYYIRCNDCGEDNR